MYKALSSLALAGMTLISIWSAALPMPEKNSGPLKSVAPKFSGYDFTGIVELSNCSGSLIRYTTSESTDHALVLTNGHCNAGGFLRPGQVIYGESTRRSFDLLNADGEAVMTLRARRILYGTMTKTDMLIYELDQTYADIFSRTGQTGLTLSPDHPVLQTQIEIISGYWKRGYSCHIEYFPYEMHESDWRWVDSIRYSRPGCEVIGGTSGSPVIDQQSRMVIGVNNTINENGRRCTRNNPCEVDETGQVFFERGIGYAQETYWVYSCLNIRREIDLNIPGCLLPR